MDLLVLDNYDSFTYNLIHLIEKCRDDVRIDVKKNDEIDLNYVNSFDKILLSPGPGLPSEAGIMPMLLKTYGPTKSIFGVCLGMQAIGEYLGAQLKNLKTVTHGIATPIHLVANDPLFSDCPQTFTVGRYHSWVIDEHGLPDCITVTAVDDQKNIMAISHKTLPLTAVQFHPESILSEYGETIISNWLRST